MSKMSRLAIGMHTEQRTFWSRHLVEQRKTQLEAEERGSKSWALNFVGRSCRGWKERVRFGHWTVAIVQLKNPMASRDRHELTWSRESRVGVAVCVGSLVAHMFQRGLIPYQHEVNGRDLSSCSCPKSTM
jgi:hypothetical protein